MKKSELIIASIVELYRLGFRSMTRSRLVLEIHDLLLLRGLKVNRNTISSTIGKLLCSNQKATGVVHAYQVMHLLRYHEPSEVIINKAIIKLQCTQHLWKRFNFWHVQ